MKKGFTLSEILITLSVIGIVAAISIPVLINQYEKQQTCIRLKKTYSELTQAVAMAEVNYGNKANWDYNLGNFDLFFEKYILPFIKISENKMSEANKEGIIYKNLKGERETNLTLVGSRARILTLASGVQLMFSTQKVHDNDILEHRQSYPIMADINGPKGPNKFGRDAFFFSLTPNGIIPHQHTDIERYDIKKSRDELLNGPSGAYQYECSKKARGLWCAALIMTDGWEIKKDYPW